MKKTIAAFALAFALGLLATTGARAHRDRSTSRSLRLIRHNFPRYRCTFR